MARDSWLKRLIWLRGSPAGGSGASYEKTVGPAPILSISDAKPKPAKSLVVGMEPIQDLHGYDNPWPAGGGANKWDGTFNTLIPLEIASGTTVCLQCVLNDTSKYITLRTYDSNQTFLQSMITASVSGNINYGVLTLTSDATYIRVEKASDVTVTNGMLSIAIIRRRPTLPTPTSAPSADGRVLRRTGRGRICLTPQRGRISAHPTFIFTSQLDCCLKRDRHTLSAYQLRRRS